MDSELGARKMNLAYASKCGNPLCQVGQLSSGMSVIIFNKRIYCGMDCAQAHTAAASARPARKAPAKKEAAPV